MNPDQETPGALGTRYEPQASEARLYPWWESHGFFTADVNAPGESYCIVIPPPNITGILHMGHALNNTLQDTLIRWKRMSGYNALWVPGTDHASIATQYVVERQLRQEGFERPREELGREKFLERIWEWKEKHGGIIIEQLKRMGCSCDWTRERFTMDEGLSRAVRAVFARLYEEGLIYKGNYLINWCPRCLTTLADDEVEHDDKTGNMWHLRYPIEGQPGRFAVVATTRPETMLGDMAVAVNPKDERYQDLIGKFVNLPLTDRRIPIIADDFVDRDFGTGMVKITPAHDPNDYQAGKRHGLEELNIFTPDAKVNAAGGSYAGLDRYAARKKIVADLQELGLMEKIEEHPQRIGKCYRCDTVIEPYISLQWFVKMAPLAGPAREAVETDTVRFRPEARKADLYRWLDNLRDWCISRQLWWGHQIPAFYRADGSIIVAKDEAEYEALRKEVAEGSTGLTQDEDVLDTWFSSALWPFSTLGWPDESPELKRYYPTATLSTGKDIIFLWVSRMIMMGLHFKKEVPFRDVFFHPIVADEKGKKMSKSTGNTVDPLVLMDEYGTDALRITLASYSSREQHIPFAVKEVENYRNFLNKVWNASRLILSNVGDLRKQDVEAAGPLDAKVRAELHLEDQWILDRFGAMNATVNQALKDFDFDVAVKSFREFFWNDFCDYYLELVKPRLYANPTDMSATPQAIKSRTQAQALLFTILESSVRLLHPFCPFITEELHQSLKKLLLGGELDFNSPGLGVSQGVAPAPFSPTSGSIIHGITHPTEGEDNTLGVRTLQALESKSIMIAPWLALAPDALASETAKQQFEKLSDIVYSIRNIRGELRIPPGFPVRVELATGDQTMHDLLQSEGHIITTLTPIKGLTIVAAATGELSGASAISQGTSIAVELPQEMREQEAKRLEKEITRLEGEIERISAKLNTPSFRDKAPAAIIAKEEAQLNKTKSELNHLKQKALN